MRDGFQRQVERLRSAPGCSIIGEGPDWVAWRDDSARQHIDILSEDGRGMKGITIESESVISDMLASAKWVSSLTATEKDRALAAIEVMEPANA